LEVRQKQQQQHVLETKRVEKIITLSRHNITERMSIYEDQQISQHLLTYIFVVTGGNLQNVARFL